MIWKTESEDQKADISTKGLQGEIFVRVRKLVGNVLLRHVFQRVESEDTRHV